MVGAGVIGVVVSGTEETRSDGAGLGDEVSGLGLGLASSNSFPGTRPNGEPAKAIGTCKATSRSATTRAMSGDEGERMEGS